MPGSLNTSFIPKHNPSNKPARNSSPKQVFIGTFLVRVLFFAVLIAAAAIFFYQRHLNGQLKEAVDRFKAATDTYQTDTEKLQTITSMDKRLSQANNLLQNSVAVSSLLKSLEQTTAEPIQFTALEYSHVEKGKLALEAEILTDGFNPIMFQRSLFTSGELFQDTTLEDVTIETNLNATNDQKGVRPEATLSKSNQIKFKAIINIDPKSVKTIVNTPFIPVGSATSESSSSIETASSTSDISIGFDNQENI